MTDSAEPRVRRYSAFLSYSQRDTPFVRKLHRWLEAYRLPARLAKGASRRRLKPLFRDSDELAAASDLTAAVRTALADADFLIVICSPRSAQSKWVGREIELFRHLHGGKRILTALIEGDAETSFHPALLRRPHGRATEPLAADFRPGMGGHRIAFVKLMAPLAGVELDELIHRDGQRQVRQLLVGVGGAVAATAVVAVAGFVAMTERTAAERERTKGHALVQSVLNVRKGLKSAGRLDLQGVLTTEALEAYRRQDLAQLADSDLQEWTQLLQAAGEDKEKKGDLVGARADFIEARRTTAALLAARPNDPKRIFDHAQSEYWVGFINWKNGDGEAAREGFERYAALAGRLLAKDPANPDWLMEAGYAQSNLGMLALRKTGDAATAETHFAAALKRMRQVATIRPDDLETRRQVADGFAWLADSQRIQRNFAAATANRVEERNILKGLRAHDPRDVQVRRELLYNDLAMARIDAGRGHPDAALTRLDQGRLGAVALAQSDPLDKRVAKQARMFELFKVRVLLDLPPSRRPGVHGLMSTLRGCSAEADFSDPEVGAFCTTLEAHIQALSGDAAGANRRLGALHLPPGANVYSATWGINFSDETASIKDATASLGAK